MLLFSEHPGFGFEFETRNFHFWDISYCFFNASKLFLLLFKISSAKTNFSMRTEYISTSIPHTLFFHLQLLYLLLPFLIIQLPFLSLHPNFHFPKVYFWMVFYLRLVDALIKLQDHALCSAYNHPSMSHHQINYSTARVDPLSLLVFS